MSRDGDRLDPSLQDLLERGRIVRRLPDVVRTRALARARATIAAAASGAPAFAPATAVRSRGRWLAVAASLALALGATGAALALRGRALHRLEPTPPSSPRAVPDARSTRRDRPTADPGAVPHPIAKAKPRAGRPISAQESYAAELALLQRAQVAYTGGDFQGARALVAEHARQFPNGRLAEDREALRVRSLAGSGHADEARRAIAAFADRFPRSVLLPRLQEASP